jgi:hypothetical protein
VSGCDLNGIERAVEITAGTLYEAVAQALRLFRENDWVGEIGQGLTTIKVVMASTRSFIMIFAGVLPGASSERSKFLTPTWRTPPVCVTIGKPIV